MSAQTHPLVALSFFSLVSLVSCSISLALFILFVIVLLVIISHLSSRVCESTRKSDDVRHVHAGFAARARYEQSGTCATWMGAAASRMVLEQALHMPSVCVLHGNACATTHARARAANARGARDGRGSGKDGDEARERHGRGMGTGEAEADRKSRCDAHKFFVRSLWP